MRLIIAGGRDFKPTKTHAEWLDSLYSELLVAGRPITQVVCGMAPGADMFGHRWAKHHGIDVAEFPANWAKHGRAAGPKRNEEMAVNADGVVLFPGGRGTQSMFEIAKMACLTIWDWRERKIEPPPLSRGEIVNILEQPDEQTGL